ncbi:hypothetical protein E2C01_085267 [Portunus trituberculatus]|uniref:Uncharacterized protein n=1 Tax=Portunus trituberculatus TaxID=210409 RepID=A0A5B7J0I0_PORTR|nr:hypothetical protein [Portunus trituberculatus]
MQAVSSESVSSLAASQTELRNGGRLNGGRGLMAGVVGGNESMKEREDQKIEG